MIPTIDWHNKYVRMVDQRKLPGKVEWYTCRGYKDVIKAIKDMVIRGAPAIGIAAAMGFAMGAASIRSKSYRIFQEKINMIASQIILSRPTAVNLKWSVERMSALVKNMEGEDIVYIKDALRKESLKILAEDIEINRRIGKRGQVFIPKNATILTHCNAGSLATGGYGTALGVIRSAVEMGKKVSVIADETRPWLQGLRLTAFELMEEGIPVHVIADNAAGFFMKKGRIDLVVTGADRIAANGDVANKIGTYQVALMANAHRIPFYVAAPVSTIDFKIKSGDMIPVEERDPDEICFFGKTNMGPRGVSALNPAFDITPSKYVTAIITERGIVKPPFKQGIKKITP
jgi:methylthioribose-1-phosphate isomerase